ncbi:YtxH domain-containing protein [Deinococcus aestuarii]|uniref:YtxH domain-containing protein n=1 Tax=Deinococcus aestuarii TaxID=2774531 RepID=UPI001C0DE8F0|nr:YtxH domain-containing protein [Deinococcus aestuarii]
MTHLEEQAHDLKEAAQDVGRQFERQMSAGAARGLAKTQANFAATLARHQQDLHRLEAQMERLQHERRGGGGFPWGLVLLAGVAYALYRSNPSFRDRIRGLLRQVSPGLEGHLARAGDAAKDAVSDVMRGDDPRDALRDAGGERRRAGEKAADQAGDKLRDLQHQAQDSAQDLRRDAQRAADDLRDDSRRH